MKEKHDRAILETIEGKKVKSESIDILKQTNKKKKL